MNIWLTQSELTANNLAKKLVAPANVYPVLKSQALPVVPFTIAEDACLIITSITALKYWQYPFPEHVIVMGQASADYARTLGIEPIVASGEGSESLLAEINIPKTQVIVASAVVRRGLVEQELTDKGYEVTSIALYENLPISTNIEYIKTNIKDFDILVVASMQAATILQPLVADKSINWVTLPRIANSLNAFPGKLLVAENTRVLADVINKCYLEHSN